MLYVDVVTEENYFIMLSFKQLGYHIFNVTTLLY